MMVFIADEDLKLRGSKDLIGFQQSGLILNSQILFTMVIWISEQYIKDTIFDINQEKYLFLLKLFDGAEIIQIKLI